jgi:hypothetical protein
MKLHVIYNCKRLGNHEAIKLGGKETMNRGIPKDFGPPSFPVFQLPSNFNNVEVNCG